MGGTMAIADPALIVGEVTARGYLAYSAWYNEQINRLLYQDNQNKKEENE